MHPEYSDAYRHLWQRWRKGRSLGGSETAGHFGGQPAGGPRPAAVISAVNANGRKAAILRQ